MPRIERERSVSRRAFVAGIGIAVVALVCVLPGRTDAATARLVKDINTAPLSFSVGAEFVAAGDRFFCTRNDPEHGEELWVSDGTPAGTRLVKDIVPGTVGSQPHSLAAVGERVFFLIGTDTTDAELWISDGTDAGTHLVADAVLCGYGYGGGMRTTLLGERLFFWREPPQHGSSANLWVSDGTETGTCFVKGLFSYPTWMATAGARFFFVAGGFSPLPGSRGLWVSDGTEAGTRFVRAMPECSECLDPSTEVVAATAVGDWLFLTVKDYKGRYELWASDGTEAGTLPFHTLVGRDAAWCTSYPYWAPHTPVLLGDRFLVNAYDPDRGTELWASDGTAAGTHLVKDIAPGAAASDPCFGPIVGGLLFFWAQDPVHGTELWVSDGTEAGTRLVKDIVPGATGSASFSCLRTISAGDRIFFRADTPAYGPELWVSDGTEAGTRLVKDIVDGSAGSAPRLLETVGGLVYLSARNPARGEELWVSDGTEAGTRLFWDLGEGARSSSPAQLTPVGERLFFVATDAEHGQELWVSDDGTEAGTVLVKDIVPGNQGSRIEALTAVGDRLFFSAPDLEYRGVWVSDGTDAGTRRIADGVTRRFAAAGTRAFYVDYPEGKLNLWISDGTEAGTHIVKTIDRADDAGYPYADAPDRGLMVVGERAFFRNHYAQKFELWVSDGTDAGTTLLAALDADESEYGWMGPSWLTAVGPRLFFTVQGPPEPAGGFYTTGLWVSDGTREGTRLVAKIDPAPPGFTNNSFVEVYDLVAVGERLFFAVFSWEISKGSKDAVGSELWMSDGTEEGTRLVRVFGGSRTVHDTGWDDPWDLQAVGERLFFKVDHYFEGAGLWVTDGTEGGTGRVMQCDRDAAIAAFDGRVFLGATDAKHGDEVWVSDGTSAGSGLYSELAPGSGGSAPGDFTVAGTRLFFTAHTGAHGRELWVAPAEFAIPKAVFSISPEGCQDGHAVRLDGGASMSAQGSVIVDYSWSFGDGTTVQGPRVDYEYPPGATGLFEVSLTVTNDLGFSDSASRFFCINGPFRRGDANADGSVDIADAIACLQYLFGVGTPLPCASAADANDDGNVDIADAITVLSHLFAHAGPLKPPFGMCGVDLTDDTLDCASFSPCQ